MYLSKGSGGCVGEKRSNKSYDTDNRVVRSWARGLGVD